MLPPIREFSTQNVPVRDFANHPGFTLRELAPADISAFIEIGLPTCAFMHGRPDTPPERIKRDFSTFVRDYAFDTESEVYVVENPEHAIVAQLWLHTTRNRFNRLDELWIWDITVREAYHRQGIGRQLMEFARHRAETKNCAELWLLVSSRNHRAIPLYESVGLTAAGLLMAMPMSQSDGHKAAATQFRSAELRALRAADIPSLWTLWESAGLPFRPKGRDRQDRLAIHLTGNTPGGWGAFEKNQLVAAALTSCDGRKGFIERLATDPQHRRAGLAKAIVTACSQSLKEAGSLVIAALIEAENTASRQLFESCGFVHSPSICYYSRRESSED